jgi:ABC-type uncharacterized transport system substrate-binding protein
VPTPRLLALCALALAIASVRPAEAHPHVQVETETQLGFDPKGRLASITHAWTFDEFYSSYAVQGLERGEDGQLSAKALDDLTKVNVEYIGERAFFTYLRHDVRHVSLGSLQNARTEIVAGRVRLHFTVPIANPFPVAGKPLALQVYDRDYFVAFVPADGEPLRLVAAPGGCRVDFAPPKAGAASVGSLSESFFQALGANANFGQQFAGRFTVTCP